MFISITPERTIYIEFVSLGIYENKCNLKLTNCKIKTIKPDVKNPKQLTLSKLITSYNTYPIFMLLQYACQYHHTQYTGYRQPQLSTISLNTKFMLVRFIICLHTR